MDADALRLGGFLLLTLFYLPAAVLTLSSFIFHPSTFFFGGHKTSPRQQDTIMDGETKRRRKRSKGGKQTQRLGGPLHGGDGALAGGLPLGRGSRGAGGCPSTGGVSPLSSHATLGVPAATQ